MRDREGRSLVLRGVNAKQPGIFDVTFSDGREARYEVPSFDADDAAYIRKSGFNVVRLPINWSAIEPQAVLGYELFNEPISSDEEAVAFAVKVTRAIRQVDARHLVIWEPSAIRNITEGATVSNTPFPEPGTVYAAHVYTLRSGDWERRLAGSIHGARDEANAWGTPLMV
jgi:Cellulase (glycosyl hydrolase family 5)